ncbi:GspE/PulE family protein [Pelagicoccus mobilis]|uniref:Flp pilus assembly complex ATPase component TadA n=1 Tax=Pelagicoccus mobilis TaxID=415221 RepID=A0A934RXJ2_9BACT|nr:ATPase, T2SS/T4P/T4SS family [Pelagicoccus mobilis]MBK1879565.1 Flp pilus assembly complex ATPase component TadA [Pelagicoccus mobilis]
MADSTLILQVVESRGLVSNEQLRVVRESLPKAGDEEILEALYSKGYADRKSVVRELAKEFAIDSIDLSEAPWPDDARSLLPEALARRFQVFPLSVGRDRIRVAVSDPLQELDTLSHLLGKQVEPVLAAEEDLEIAIDASYLDSHETASARLSKEERKLADEVQVAESGVEISANMMGEDDAPIIRLVQVIISDAVRLRASDIHFEPLETRFRVRFRIDGQLQELPNPPPRRLQLPVISRIKVMGKMSIAEKRLPQDGRIQVKVEGTEYDLRVSTLPTAYGESIVMRVLDKSGLMLGLPELGFLPDDQESYERMIAMPDGMLLVTGPTGSGKTTTLYSCLHHLNKPDRKIITVEDPIEYQMPGINQVPVKKEIGMSFSAALKAILRQAPNIIMIGEIRDLETAEIAINASLTGHMVFSTLHTNDAPSAVTRLVDIGVKPYLVATSLRAALAQRLVRKICPSCQERYEPTIREMHAIGLDPEAARAATFMRGRGCDECHEQGFRGRFGVFEIFKVDEEVERLIYSNGTAAQLRSLSRQLGMRSMREDGVRKVMSGMTTVEEVLSVTVDEPVFG